MSITPLRLVKADRRDTVQDLRVELELAWSRADEWPVEDHDLELVARSLARAQFILTGLRHELRAKAARAKTAL